MAKKSDVKDVKDVEAVEVEHALNKGDSAYFGKGFRVFFVGGKATVTSEAAKVLKEANVIK